MGPALDRVDVVDEGVYVLRVAVGVLHGQLDDHVVLLGHQVDGLLMQLVPVVVQVLHELDDAALVVEAVLSPGDLVLEVDDGRLVQVCQVLELLRQDVVLELDRLEDGLVGHEGYGCAAAFGRSELLQRNGHDAPLASQEVLLAFAVHPHLQPFGEGVHYRHADAVQAAGHLVALAVELAPGVKNGQNHLHRRPLVFRHEPCGDAATIIGHGDAAVRIDGYVDVGAVAAHHLVNSVVHDLIDQMMKAPGIGAAYVHAWPLANGLQAFQHLNAVGVIARVLHIGYPL